MSEKRERQKAAKAMVVPLNKPVVCPVVIGRTTELTAIHQLIESTKSGQGQVALLSGEAGIGKSRLIKEAKVYATDLNFRVVQGNCFPTDLSCPLFKLDYTSRTQIATWVIEKGLAREKA